MPHVSAEKVEAGRDALTRIHGCHLHMLYWWIRLIVAELAARQYIDTSRLLFAFDTYLRLRQPVLH